MPKTKILFQLDSDAQVSTFDSVVAIDAGVEQLFRHAAVTPENVPSLVHGAIFTRGVEDLKSTAIFVGGSHSEAAEALTHEAIKTFFGPMRVSLMADPNGANTTAAAAVLSAESHLTWEHKTVTILAATGPVGKRIAQIVGQQSKLLGGTTNLRLVSRSLAKADRLCQQLNAQLNSNFFTAYSGVDRSENLAATDGADVVFAAGAAGVCLLGEGWLTNSTAPEVAIDLNAVPPAGLTGIEVFDRGQLREKTTCYGAIGVGGLKMKIHKRCLQTLFESNDRVLQVAEIYQIGKQLSNRG